MEQRFLDAALEKYKWQPNQFSGKKECYAVTTKANFRKENYSGELTLIPEDTKPSSDIKKKAKLLYIDQESGDFLKNLEEMNKLETLRILSKHIAALKDFSVPKSINFLSILHNESDFNSKNLNFPNGFINIKALAIINSIFVKPNKRVEGELRIDENNFPNLEYLRFMFDSKHKALNLIENFKNLLHLCVGGVEKVNIFDFLGDKLSSLHIEGADKEFETAQMSRVPSIEMIRFNSIHNVINCEDFLKMPKLKEIFILNSKSLINVEALLEMKSLKSLEILNCKGAMKKPLKDKFNSTSGFEYLRVDYA